MELIGLVLMLGFGVTQLLRRGNLLLFHKLYLSNVSQECRWSWRNRSTYSREKISNWQTLCSYQPLHSTTLSNSSYIYVTIINRQEEFFDTVLLPAYIVSGKKRSTSNTKNTQTQTMFSQPVPMLEYIARETRNFKSSGLQQLSPYCSHLCSPQGNYIFQ